MPIALHRYCVACLPSEDGISAEEQSWTYAVRIASDWPRLSQKS